MSWQPNSQDPQHPPQQHEFGPPPVWHQPTPEPPRRTKALLAAVGAVVVLAAIGVGMAVAMGGDDEKSTEAKPKPPQGSPSASTSPTVSSTPSSSSDQPMIPGWQTQTREEHHFRYDVPSKADKWQVFDPGTAISYNDETGKPLVVMTGVANYREGGCPSQANPNSIGEAGKGQLATVGTTGGGTEGTLRENARNWAGNWGFVAYGGEDHKPEMEVSQAKPWKRGGIEGYTATAKVTVTYRPSPCVPPKAIVHSIAQKLPDGTMHGWVIYADQGVPHALTDAQIQKIMSTVRSTDG